MNHPLAIALLIALALAALFDVRYRRIPHALVAVIAILWLATVPELGPSAAAAALATAGGVLVAGIVVWRCGWLGGGDVKLIAALGLWAGPDQVAGLLLTVALSGGALALLALMRARILQMPLCVIVQFHAARLAPVALRLPAWSPAESVRSLPYGVAVACGGAWLVHRLAFA